MGGLALLAKALGHAVSGSDAQVYPPMSTQLADQGIALKQGYLPEHLDPAPDIVVVGNAMTRGNPAVEYLLNADLAYTSGPQWLAEHVLRGRWVLAAAGTHGKTTTASLLAWILEYAGLAPGFLIGGVPENFGVSARLGRAPFFVIEADEYDTAFFDKRSKFIHYRPRTLVLNNLEYDHADIFPDLEAIQRQFHHLVRTVPGQGRIIVAQEDPNLTAVLRQGCWTPVEGFAVAPTPAPSLPWQARLESPEGSRFTVYRGGMAVGQATWELSGRYNVHNALAAIAAAAHVGVAPDRAIEALAQFRGVKRRQELRGVARGVAVYDDFAHHPTAIAVTLEGLRRKVGSTRILAVLEPRSNTMRLGVHRDTLAGALALADEVILYQPPNLGWDVGEVAGALGDKARVFADSALLVQYLAGNARAGDHILIMSNGPFAGIHGRLLEALEHRGEHAGAGPHPP
jgi:UDP-N-acetylmuramate: L-alanyl-gamma-D-glutamyl-meso-diaminopimelate ligase